MRVFRKRSATALLTGVVLLAGAALSPARADNVRLVPVPDVEVVPAEVGIRGGPHGATHSDPAEFGYVEEELFISGLAKSYGAATEDAEYRTRLYVLRPADPAAFNGTVLMEWNNVTGQIDASPVWYLAHEHLIREGFIFVGVAAQQAGHEPSPLALKAHDPVRYGSLHHPGDDYSWDMFSQAGMAVLAGEPSPVAGYEVERLIATGQSQSGGRLGSYLRHAHREGRRSLAPGNAGGRAPDRLHPHERRVFDGVMPMTANAVNVATDVGPVLWVNEVRDGHADPDAGDFRLIEIAGAPHFTWWGLQGGVAAGHRNNQRALPGIWDREGAAQYGERGGGPCPRSFFPDRFAYSAAIDQMDRWLRTGIAPQGWPRIERTESGSVVRDEHGNPLGGFRLPAVDVPVATYSACGLFGSTETFDPAKMAALYPTHDDYVAKMQAAVDDAVNGGRMLAIDGEELMDLARASSVGDAPILLSPR
jgi:hypothetical protein